MKTPDEMQAESDAAIAAANVPTEAEMRDSTAPWTQTETELMDYIRSLVERPHGYGTCVYAMSLAATAALYYVAGRLGTTGFQAGCADMDILRRTRNLEWGRILDYQNLLYPQYLTRKHFPGWQDLLVTHRAELAKRAHALLEKQGEYAAPEVAAHWRALVAAAEAEPEVRS